MMAYRDQEKAAVVGEQVRRIQVVYTNISHAATQIGGIKCILDSDVLCIFIYNIYMQGRSREDLTNDGAHKADISTEMSDEE